MGIKTENGFTIIEVMLFLAVTGLMAAAILVGSGVAIGQQRYRDSVTTLKSYIQQQYSEVTNVVNSRDKTWTCDSNGNITEVSMAAGDARGTSECVMLGRYVTIDSTGKIVRGANVIGYRTPGAPEATSDLAELTSNYRLAVSPIDQDENEVSWGAQVVRQSTTTPMPLTILILRSPLSGTVLTFTAEGVQTNLASLMTVANMSQRRELCMNAEIGSFVGERLSVRIDAYATNQSAILVPKETESVCD